MPHHLDFSGNRLWLGGDCIYIQLGDVDAGTKELKGEQKAVVFDHKRKTHYTPENDAAKLVLDVLTQEQGKGVKFDDIVDNLVEKFQLTKDEAKGHLNDFLNDLKKEGLLGHDEQAGVSVGVLKAYKGPKKPKHEAKGKIKHGGTIICCGYVVSRYRP